MSSSVPRRQREDESEETAQPPPLTQPQHEGIAPPPAIPILPVSSHVSVPTAPITTVADLKKTVGSAPTHVAAATCVMFLVNREKLDAWKEVLGNEEDQRILARDARVYHCVIDVDAAPEALGMVRPGEDIEIPSAHVFRHDGKGWKKHSEKSVSKPIDLTSLLCIAPVHDFSHLHNRIAEAHSRGVTHLVTYSGATWCPPCRRIMPFIASIIDALNAKLASKGSVIEVVKIDRDAAEAIDQVYGVEYIPFFQVFRTADAAAHAAALDFDLPALRPEEPTDAEWEAGLAEARAVAQKPIASLQDSTPEKVAQFLETHCTPLSFNEEF